MQGPTDLFQQNIVWLQVCMDDALVVQEQHAPRNVLCNLQHELQIHEFLRQQTYVKGRSWKGSRRGKQQREVEAPNKCSRGGQLTGEPEFENVKSLSLMASAKLPISQYSMRIAPAYPFAPPGKSLPGMVYNKSKQECQQGPSMMCEFRTPLASESTTMSAYLNVDLVNLHDVGVTQQRCNLSLLEKHLNC